jgi:KUP system potassium uptake protein
VFLVIVFKSSSAFASAYGIAVTGTMVVTTTMAFFVLWKCWKWSPAVAALVIVPFLAVDLSFLFANLLKIVEGGWMPLAVGLVLMLISAPGVAARVSWLRRPGRRMCRLQKLSPCWPRARRRG